MPELAEVKITSDYINESVKGKFFKRIEKNPEHKGEEVYLQNFEISSESRGKELRMMLNTREEVFPFVVTLGMGGHFKLTKTGEALKHSHLKFIRHDGYTLSFVDIRRFGKWAIRDWNPDRGPDPVYEHSDFITHVKKNLHKRAFEKPICEVLMDQRYFNGIGNYLRAEILHRLDCNPFLNARVALYKTPEILDLCKKLPQEAYILGGGQLKDWQFPTGVDATSFKEWMQCYHTPGNNSLEDKKGRRIWYHTKWEKEAQEYLQTFKKNGDKLLQNT